MQLTTETDFHDWTLDRYRVMPDPDGVVLVPGGAVGWLLRRWRRPVPRSEAELLRGLSPLSLLAVFSISRDASRRCTREFDRDGFHGGEADAFRHIYWNARLVQRFGEDWTLQLTTAHERLPAVDPIVVAMDLHNNAVGRRIGLNHPRHRGRSLAATVTAAVRGGQAAMVGTDGRLCRTRP